ncbi:protein kinase [Rhizophagus clarus]|uniref:Protein kinase n=1 Tax=Rhizophagus clarus TaxID=94130 RepID=A0A8H3KSB0_9GLOM|nr:protein kinase [Rhizophagus clarus]
MKLLWYKIIFSERKRIGSYFTRALILFILDGELLVSGSWDSTARLWSLKEKKLLATFDHQKSFGHKRPCIECVSFYPDSELIVTGGWNYTVTLWSIKD